MRTILTIQELLKGRNAEFDNAAKQEGKVQMVRLPFETAHGKNGVSLNTSKLKSVNTFSDFIEKVGKDELRKFLSEWHTKSYEPVSKAEYVVVFWTHDHKSGDSKVPSKLLGVYKVENSQNKNNKYVLDLKEVREFDIFLKKTVIDFKNTRPLTIDFSKNGKRIYVI